MRYVFEDRERYVFFSETSTSHHHTVVLHNTHSHSHTNTHSHTHAGPTVAAGQVVPEEFFSGFAKFLDHMWSARIFFGRQGGHATSENISRVLEMFRLFMFVFVCRHYAAMI